MSIIRISSKLVKTPMGYMGTLSGVVCGVEKEGMLGLGEYDGVARGGWAWWERAGAVHGM
ncbi:unnamed protein product [Prunus armeniaca]|uniref:Uncharacterized protein n=1 Tax=Prunus armeniaca TaxID=36596 RepID=A0A6J5WKK4_PRUAR|nr:unnamed protein product [Prunus armeniaca]CAB4300903.1 unnamed protein product [Prunus armeniaca]